MTPNDMQMVLDDLEYKPDWAFMMGLEWPATLYLTRRVPDSTRPDHPMVKVIAAVIVPPPMRTGNGYTFLQWVKGEIRKQEIHEMDEFLRYKGELLHDPHHRDQRMAAHDS